MYTLIPEQSAKYLKKEYRIRALILLLLFMSLGTWVGIVCLFPSFLISVTQEKRAVVAAGVVEQSAQSASTTGAIAQISSANSNITTLQGSQDTVMLSSIVEDIDSRRVPGIVINDFEIGRSGPTGTNIVIRGEADTRQDLVEFENNLTADSRFSKVVLPVSYLAPDTDAAFSISITGLQ